MMSMRSFFLAACVLPLSLAACGGSSEDGSVVPEGTHYGYVVSKAFLPTTNKQATDYGLDLGAAKSGTPDGTVDNRLGQVFVTLASMGFDLQTTVNTAVDEGSIILLVDFQTKDFMNSAAAGLTVKLGANPVPAACTGTGTAKVCAHHLDGKGMFSIATDSPTDAAVTGKIVNGTFNGGPGDISLQIALGTTQPITLSLLNARAKATGVTDTGMTTTVGGALSVTDLNGQVIPAIGVQIQGILDRDCVGATPANNCTCPGPATTGKTLLGLFDGDIAGTLKDCKISAAEISGNAIIKSLLGPDVCSTKTCTAPDALSLGIQVTTVKAAF